MKALFSLLLVFAFARPLAAQERREHAPAPIQRSFQRDYPEARQPRWSSTNAQWHANFEDHSRFDRGEMVAHYDRYGHHVDSHIPYDRNDVPEAVIRRTQRNYPDGRDYSYTRIEHPGGQPLFQVSLNWRGSAKTLYLDDNGRPQRYHDRH